MAIFMHLNQTKLFLLSPAGILGSEAPSHQGCSAEPGHLRWRGAEKASRNYGWVPETLEQRENRSKGVWGSEEAWPMVDINLLTITIKRLTVDNRTIKQVDETYGRKNAVHRTTQSQTSPKGHVIPSDSKTRRGVKASSVSPLAQSSTVYSPALYWASCLSRHQIQKPEKNLPTGQNQ